MNLYPDNKKQRLNLICGLFILLMITTTLATGQEIELLYFGEKEETAFIGFGQGLEDANQDKQLHFRIKLETESFRPFNDPKPAAIFTSMGTEAIRILSVLNPQIPIFNLVDDSAEVRQLCRANIFHIRPAKAMREAAIAAVNSNKQRDSLQALSWHSSYQTDKAVELNQCFHHKRNMVLTEQGFSGWIGARIFVESLLNNDSGGLIQALRNENSKIDSYKMLPALFNADGQLLQPLLVISDDQLVGQYPDNIASLMNGNFAQSYCR